MYNVKAANRTTISKIMKKFKKIQLYINFNVEKQKRLKNNTKKTMLNRRFAQSIHDNAI